MNNSIMLMNDLLVLVMHRTSLWYTCLLYLNFSINCKWNSKQDLTAESAAKFPNSSLLSCLVKQKCSTIGTTPQSKVKNVNSTAVKRLHYEEKWRKRRRVSERTKSESKLGIIYERLLHEYEYFSFFSKSVQSFK